MKYKIQSFLDRIGLSHQEAVLYIAAIEAGASSVAQLAKRAGIHRVEAYALTAKLLQRGLARQTMSKGKKLFEALHPRQLEQLVAGEHRRVRKLELAYDELLPELDLLYKKVGSRPKVHFYEGMQGLEQMNRDIIDTVRALPPEKREINSYSNPPIVLGRFEGYLDQEGGFVAQRKKYQIFNKVIVPDHPFVRQMKLHDAEELREMIILPPSLFPFRNDITLYHTKMAIQALGPELVGVIIESKEIADGQRAIFSVAWAGAKEIEKSISL